MELNNTLHWGVSPVSSPKGWLPDAPKDDHLYGRENGKRKRVHPEVIDGGYADPNQTEMIDWWGA
jgi:hypothetical protein